MLEKHWGNPSVPLLPANLRHEWADDPLPVWLIEELELPGDATFAALDHEALKAGHQASERTRNFLGWVISSRIDELDSVKVGQSIEDPADVTAGRIPWRVRTINTLRKNGLLSRPDAWAELTFGELLRLPSMGAFTVLDFVCTLEGGVSDDSVGALMPPDGREPVNPAMSGAHAAVESGLEEALREDWAEQISAEDPRFRPLLPPGTGTLNERILGALPKGGHSPEAQAYSAALPNIHARVDELKSMGLEEALRDFLSTLVGIHDKRLAPLLGRLNWNGRPEALTLEEAGTLAGVSRERVRQLEQKVRQRLPGHAVFMPALERAMQVLAGRTPIQAEEAGNALAAAGISCSPFDPASVLVAAHDLNHPASVSIEILENIRTVVCEPFGHVAPTVVRITRGLIGGSGVASVARVAAAASAAIAEPITEDRVRQILALYCAPLYLDEAEEWFRSADGRTDAVRDLSRRMLSVTSQLDIPCIREGLKRVFRFRNSSSAAYRRWNPSAPPNAILRKYYENHSEFVLSAEGLVRSVVPLDPAEQLARVDHVIVTALRASPNQILHRRELLAECAMRGVRSNTVTIYLSYSPVLQHLGNGYWTVRGTRVDPVHVEAMLTDKSRSRVKRVMDYGWTPEGRLWLALKVPDLVTTPHPILALPSPIRRYVDKAEYQAVTDNGIACGTIRVYEEYNTAGYSSFLRMSGADADDILLLRFDLEAATVAMTLIDADDLETISPTAGDGDAE